MVKIEVLTTTGHILDSHVEDGTDVKALIQQFTEWGYSHEFENVAGGRTIAYYPADKIDRIVVMYPPETKDEEPSE